MKHLLIVGMASAIVSSCANITLQVTTPEIERHTKHEAIDLERTSVQPPWLALEEWLGLSASQKREAHVLELRGRVECYLSFKGYRLGLGADVEFRKVIDRAASDIQMLPANMQRKRTERAVQNLFLMIDRMIIEAHLIPNYLEKNFRVIGEDTLLSALKKLCPVWPFCDKRYAWTYQHLNLQQGLQKRS